MGDIYTIADISMLGWVRNLIGFYGARELVDYDSLKEVPSWLERGLARLFRAASIYPPGHKPGANRSALSWRSDHNHGECVAAKSSASAACCTPLARHGLAWQIIVPARFHPPG
jgi:hypothetical protein